MVHICDWEGKERVVDGIQLHELGGVEVCTSGSRRGVARNVISEKASKLQNQLVSSPELYSCFHVCALLSNCLSHGLGSLGTRPSKNRKEGLVNGVGWKCKLWNVRNFINC